MDLSLVLGGARSGKSAYAQAQAEAQAHACRRELVFVATAEALDEEMALRIAHHRAGRSAAWTLVEAPLHLDQALLQARSDEVVLVDCLTLWLSNSLLQPDDGHAERIERFADALRRRRGTTLIVSNEVGWGVVPDNALARRFRDDAGRLHQTIAALADRVVLVVAGLPLILKP